MSEQASNRVSRRRFVAAAAGVGAGLALTACTSAAQTGGAKEPKSEAKAAPASASGQTFSWKLQSTWSAGDFHQNNPKFLKDIVEQMSGGRLKIEVMAAGAVVPAFELLDTVHKGLLEIGNAWPGYWTGKHPAATLFGSAPGGPFGMNNEDYLGWIYQGGGIELYNELLQNELKMDVVAFPTFGETPEPQGWFPKQITTVDEFKGLKFRAAGMSAEVFKAMGMSVVTLPGGEIIPALERKVIDAAEFSDPSSDMALGFQDVLKHYHLPGIHQPTGIMETIINKQKWDELPDDLKAIVKYGAMATNMQFTTSILGRNAEDLITLRQQHSVQVHETPPEILVEVLKGWDTVAQKHASENAFFKKVLDAQKEYASKVVPFRRFAHPPYELAADYYWKNR